MKVLSNLVIVAAVMSSMFGCAKDKNMQDYQSDQVQQQMAKINAVAGVYSGEAVSNLDSTVLGAIQLNFRPNTVVQAGNTTNVNTTQSVVVSGQVSLTGLYNASVSFNNGTYNDLTGEFQVTIPVTLLDKTTKKNIDLVGHISNGQFIGSLSTDDIEKYQANLTLTRNAQPTNVDKLEPSGTRIQQIKRTSPGFNYIGDRNKGSETVQARLFFVNKDNLPEQQFYKLISPTRLVDVNIDMNPWIINLPNSTIDDNLGTIEGSNAAVGLHCDHFGNTKEEANGYDCTVTSNRVPVLIHFLAQ